MSKVLTIFITTLVFVTGITRNSWPSKLKKKIELTVSKSFSTVDFELEPVNVDRVTNASTDLQINDHLYKVKVENEIKGFIYVGQAPSMKNVFDYIVCLIKNLPSSIQKY